MRFILALLCGIAAFTLSVFVAPPAGAHFCSNPAEINLGELVQVNIGVAAEDKPVRGVDILVPNGFDLKEPIGYLGYEGTVNGRWVHFEGAEIAPYTCTFFSFAGEATKKGRLVARIVTTAADGTKTHYDDVRPISRFPAQVIYAGEPIPPNATPSAGSGFPSIWVGLAAAILAGLAVVGVAVMVNRSRASGAP